MVFQERVYTVEDLREIEQLPGNENKQFELIRGVIVEMARAKPIHNAIISRVFMPLSTYVYSNKLGEAFGDGQNYVLTREDEFIPDVSFVSKERYPSIPDEYREAPDLAIEVISPSNSEPEISYKVEIYLRFGSRLVWTIYPKEKVVRVHRLQSDGSVNTRKIDLNGTLDGEDVLPGFKLRVRDIFPE
jgi:Uma2 family endonuclease